jgi:peroxiredoxin Q/BCP
LIAPAFCRCAISTAPRIAWAKKKAGDGSQENQESQESEVQVVKVGNKAPAFSLEGDDGKKHALKDYKGKHVVLYFYPKDSTPGCTTEACDFRDNLNRIKRAGAVVLGVSKDSLTSHEKFRAKHDLNFPLLSDPEHKVQEKYGAWGEKKLYGKVHMGTIRSTFLIDDEGRLFRAWPKVKVKGHVDEVLDALKDLKAVRNS